MEAEGGIGVSETSFPTQLNSHSVDKYFYAKSATNNAAWGKNPAGGGFNLSNDKLQNAFMFSTANTPPFATFNKGIPHIGKTGGALTHPNHKS